jgi:hypothetical protein
MEVERTVALEGRIVAADLIDQGNQRREAVGRRAIPTANFILLAVEILFAPRLGRNVFAELKGWPVDTVVSAERRSKN